MNDEICLQSLGMCNALGNTLADIARGLFSGDTSGLTLEDGWIPSARARVGRVRGALPNLPPDLSAGYSCRATRLLVLAALEIARDVESAIRRFGSDRVAVVLGTSTSGIAEGEAAIAAHCADGVPPDDSVYPRQELGMPAAFLARYFGARGPAYCVSTACTSSAKALVSARALLRRGLCDAVVVGGVDTLCRLTINGFAALELTTEKPCNPMSKNREGINIGEGAALFLMTREGAPNALRFLGAGESSDAYHVSAPHPDGEGAEAAMRSALEDAGLGASEVDYLNLHATASAQNDRMESLAIRRVFPDGVTASGTKPLTGHLLGAAGATELGLCWLALKDSRLPPHVWDGEADPDLPARVNFVTLGQRFARDGGRVCMSSSFAFGGNNVCLLIGETR
ncbi:MAG: beta-ketoacyl-ACP synthase [Candidatus Accumulibacter sp.]|jgi:3-oxoacyl-[acyl-carrier-protein] synthase-1|nr:beta-ketoacyl-ACP synthase [Accumulibacter sp.]